MSEALNLFSPELRVYSPSPDSQVAVLYGAEIFRTDLFSLLGAFFLAGGSGKMLRIPRSFTKAIWLSYCTVKTGWWPYAANPGDLLTVYGKTSDTNQAVMTYHVVTSLEESGEKCWATPFLILMEGEPPIWVNTDPPVAT